MALLASAILVESRGILNDPSGAIYPTSPMLTLLNKVYQELQTKVSTLGISTTKEVSSAITVSAGTVRLADGAGLPTDLLFPLHLKERLHLSGSSYTDMTEEDWEPDITQRNELVFWAWREEELKFPGALTDRDVLIRYVKTLGAVTATTSPIAILNSQQWLSQRLAIVAAATLGNNPMKAKVLADDLIPLWDDLKGTLVGRKQGTPVRRRRTRYRVR